MITGINHITWNVVDIEESFHFYTAILGLKPIMKSEWSAYFTAGHIWLAVVKGEPRDDVHYDHIAFQVDKANYDHLVEALLAYGVRSWKDNETEGKSFYFLDPSGNKFELHYSGLDARIEDGKKNWDDTVTWYA